MRDSDQKLAKVFIFSLRPLDRPLMQGAGRRFECRPVSADVIVKVVIELDWNFLVAAAHEGLALGDQDELSLHAISG
jgi:hypothetical protein